MFLLTEAYNLYKDDLYLKGNDMELFHLLTAGPFAINLVSPILFKNINSIKDLILNKKFIPFPPCPNISAPPSTTSALPIISISSTPPAPPTNLRVQ